MANQDRYSKICTYLRDLIEGTQWQGHLFVVGGCCRDMVMGRPIHDLDLTVDLPLGSVEFAKWLRSKRLTIGEPLVFGRYSTARLHLKKFPDEELEIVQTRSDKYGPHNVHDPGLAFGTLEDDCTRRDLTINSLYYDISADRMLDLCGTALSDIEHHIIRTPANPERTFDDDPLRKLRCVRFAADLGWEIDPATWHAVCDHPETIHTASIERIRNEFDKILGCHNPVEALKMMRTSGLMDQVIPELTRMYNLSQNAHHQGTVWENTLATTGYMAELTTDLNLRMAALLHDIGKIDCGHPGKNGQMYYHRHEYVCPRLIDTIMRRLRYEPRLIDEVVFLSRHHTAAKSWGPRGEKASDADLRRLQYECGSPERLSRLLTLIHADNLAAPARQHVRGQVKALRERFKLLDHAGLSMYRYKMPLDSPKIRRLLKIRPGEEVERCKAYLLEQAFINPRLNANQCRQLLLDRAHKAVASSADSKTTKAKSKDN